MDEIFGQGISHEKDAVLLVDVGGGTGRDIANFHENYPGIPGRLVLQDLPSVIQDAKNLPAAVELLAHDFFETQPVEGIKSFV